VTVKNLSGTWASGGTATSCVLQWTLTLEQTGNALSGTLGLVATAACSGTSTGNPGPITGSVAPGEQPVQWTGILTGPPPSRFAARVNPDVTVLSGITLCTPRTPPQPDACSTGQWVGDPLTRQ
jgi:hypothetical protein